MNGKAHRQASIALSIPTGITIAYLSSNFYTGILSGLGCAAGIFLTPDLDQEGISRSEWDLVKHLGPFGFLWMALWWPYAKVVKHRSSVSHAPIISTIIRLCYLLVFPTTLGIILGYDVFDILSDREFWTVSLYLFAGLCVSDCAHWVMDKLPRRLKHNGWS